MPTPSGTALLVQLALLALFWSVSVLHLLRLIAAPLLTDARCGGDAAHLGMGAAMVYMLFPGAPTGLYRPLAVVFGAAVLISLARKVRGKNWGAGHDVATVVGNAAMTVMFAGGARFGPEIGFIAAGCLAATTWPHLRPLLEFTGSGRHRRVPARAGASSRRQRVLPRGQQRLLVTAPHLGTAAMTLAMAWMLVR
ncbi:DUF5134 domain-containing protein [Streptomyces sp. NPDC044948]|uniref:DUF5134 domain-containing protein n=1 Tax=Streptomyces sp. NPDC044948 TaxID=3157092 RepID=UPI0033D8B0F9